MRQHLTSKGGQTALRILEAAEQQFATRGFDGTTLRAIADAAGLKEPGLYNHFESKQAIYEAVMRRALNPIGEALLAHLAQSRKLPDYTELPAKFSDMLLAQPHAAALFQRAMQEAPDLPGSQLMQQWLRELFKQGVAGVRALAPGDDVDRATLAISLVAVFNLTTTYFLCQQALDTLEIGDACAPENIARQKQLLHKVIRAMLIN